MVRTTRRSDGPGSDGQEQENFFARAVDSGARKASDPTPSDPTLCRELAVVAALRHVGAGLSPDPAERDRMRQHVMTEFSAVVHDGSSPVLTLRTSSRSRRWFPSETRGRLMVAAAATLCLLMSLSGMSVLLSRDALPGDALYTFKRTAESAELGLTFGDQPKALKHLEFASARVSEIEIMADQADTVGDWSAGQDKFRRVLDDFDSDTVAATRLLTAVASHGQTPVLSALRSWAEQQESRLSTVRAALPLPTSTRLDSTLGLLDRVAARSSALSNRSDCVTITSGTRDDLGLRPAKESCKPVLDGAASAAPLPPAPATSPSNVVPPGLLVPPSVEAVPPVLPDAQKDRPRLTTPTRPEGVLPAPGKSDDDPWRQFPQEPPSWPTTPLPLLGIPVPDFSQPPS